MNNTKRVIDDLEKFDWRYAGNISKIARNPELDRKLRKMNKSCQWEVCVDSNGYEDTKKRGRTLNDRVDVLLILNCWQMLCSKASTLWETTMARRWCTWHVSHVWHRIKTAQSDRIRIYILEDSASSTNEDTSPKKTSQPWCWYDSDALLVHVPAASTHVEHRQLAALTTVCLYAQHVHTHWPRRLWSNVMTVRRDTAYIACSYQCDGTQAVPGGSVTITFTPSTPPPVDFRPKSFKGWCLTNKKVKKSLQTKRC